MNNEPEKPHGGTEILEEGLRKHVDVDSYNVNLISSKCHKDFLVPDKKNVVWQHQAPNQPIVQQMQSKLFTEAVDKFVYVSGWQHESYKQVFRHTFKNSAVIRNAIEPIEFVEKPKDKIKLVYTSTPWRGLDILIDAFKQLNRNDVELDIYSSTRMYGEDSYKAEGHRYDYVIAKAKETKGINVIGYQPNEAIKEALKQAHIFAYPSTFEETSCLAAIEAAAAGCSIVTTVLGALPETLNVFGTLIPMQRSRDAQVKAYAKALNQAIDNYWSLSNQKDLKLQSDYFNEFYSWDRRKKEWDNLLTEISKG